MYDPLSQPIYTDRDGRQYSLEAGVEVFDLVLALNDTQRDLSQSFPRESAFLWTGLSGVSTGAYKLQVQLPDGRLLTSAAVRNQNIIGTAQFPVPIFPAIRVPAGGRIGIPTITDLSGAQNTIQIAFHGVRLIPVQR